MSRRRAILAFLILTTVVTGVALLLPPFPQPQSYHDFADQRIWLGVPNFGDVISNLAFAIVGMFGLRFVLRNTGTNQSRAFREVREKWPYGVMFFGLVMTAFGSAYYHLAPNNARLVWDRLPMTVVFMSLVAALITERISV